MNSDRSSSTDFWLALLKCGDTENKRRENWNTYCWWKLNRFIPDALKPEITERLSPLHVDSEVQTRLNKLAEAIGGHPRLPDDPSITREPIMDFTRGRFPDGISFAGRLLFAADFSDAVLGQGQRADFSNAVFMKFTQFNRAKFAGLDSVADFSGSVFHNAVRFDSVKFSNARFDRVSFRNAARFRKAEFAVGGDDFSAPRALTVFSRSEFKGKADFSDAVFSGRAFFDSAGFDSNASFKGTKFRHTVVFNNAKFGNTTSFRGASFDKPPKFFETEIHEDVNFNKVDWSGAERSYSRLHRRNAKPDSIVEDAESAARAWDRLALIMSQRERLIERHEFFRLKMRAQRQRDGFWPPSSIASLLFDWLSDYGWGIGRAFSWWIIHIAAVGFILAVLASKCSSGSISAWRHVLRFLPDGLSLSFANSHAFLRLASDEGWLRDSRDGIVDSCESGLLLSYIGLFQAVLGPVLLFLVLLTLRNRFRLG